MGLPTFQIDDSDANSSTRIWVFFIITHARRLEGNAQGTGIQGSICTLEIWYCEWGCPGERLGLVYMRRGREMGRNASSLLELIRVSHETFLVFPCEKK